VKNDFAYFKRKKMERKDESKTINKHKNKMVFDEHLL
jgi:hypothetical protein